MPQWIHDRAEHLMGKNPSMPKSMAFALATQQSHASGHTPKGYGTPEGKKTAKKKYSEPKSHYEQKADPEVKEAAIRIKGFWDEIEKIAAAMGSAVKSIAMPGISPLKGSTTTMSNVAAATRRPSISKGVFGSKGSSMKAPSSPTPALPKTAPPPSWSSDHPAVKS